MDSRAPNGQATVSLAGVRDRVLSDLGRLSRRLPASRAKRRAGRALAMVLGRPQAVPCSFDGVHYVLAPADRTQAEPFWDGSYEDDLVAFVNTLVDADDVLVDGGANVGLIAVRAAAHLRSLGGHGRVVAFEPVRANVDLLERSVVANGLDDRCVVVRAGLADSDGTALISVESAGGGSGNAVIGAGDRQGARQELVALAPLDRLLREAGTERVAVMKLDLEGSEVSALRGARATLVSDRPIIVAEFNADLMPLHGTTVVDAVELLDPLGYRFFAFTARLAIEEVTPEVGRGDLCAVPEERISEVRSKLERVFGHMRTRSA